MSGTRSELQKKARSAMLQYAFFRWESAVVLAGTILLTALWPRPFSWWPVWGWPLLGLVGLVGLVYSSLTDVETNARVLLQLFQQQYDPRKIKDQALRREVETALEYQRRIEAQARQQRPGALRERLENTANQLSDWIGNIYELALRLDDYRRNELLARERETVPREIEELAARRKLESDSALQRKLDQVLESKGKQWQTLRALDTRMKQAELQLEQSMTALATVHSQLQLIDARDVDSGRSARLEVDIREQVEQLDDLINSINEISKEMSGGISGV
jgi:biopolymer transport protein ExbB/TolQ